MTPDKHADGAQRDEVTVGGPAAAAAVHGGCGRGGQVGVAADHAYGYVLVGIADVTPGIFGKQESAAVRPLFLLLVLVFALVVSGPMWRRLRLLVTTVAVFCLLTLLTDLALTRLAATGGPGPFGALSNTVAGSTASLPSRSESSPRR